jgi:hypothetical protein
MFLYINMSQTYVSFVVITIWSLPHSLHHNLLLASSITSQSDPCLIHYITIWSLPHPLHITIWSLPHPLYITIWSLPHPLHIIEFATMASPTSRTGTAYPSATSEFNTPRFVTLVLRVIFCHFSFGHCIVCPSQNYGFWLLLWYLQIFLRIQYNFRHYNATQITCRYCNLRNNLPKQFQ